MHTISKRTQEFNSILQKWIDFFKSPLKAAILELYRSGKTEADVARITGFSPGIINRKYPNPFKKRKEGV